MNRCGCYCVISDIGVDIIAGMVCIAVAATVS